MKKDLDKQLDPVMERIARDASLDAGQVDHLASSPEVWWGIQRKLAPQKEALSPWSPPPKLWNRIAFWLPAFAAILLVAAGVLWLLPSAQHETDALMAVADEPPIDKESPVAATAAPDVPAGPVVDEREEPIQRSFRNPSRRRGAVRKESRAVQREEIRSEFVALTNGSSPEGGHVVRVRVPRLMMVSVGLVSSVESPSALIDADVVVGDDGRTHAIRFITQ